MRIGVDIDDTIVNTTDFINYYLSIYYPSYSCYRDLPKEDFNLFVSKMLPNLYRYELVKKHVSYVFKELKRLGHTIIFITARGDLGDFYEEYTKSFFELHDISYDTIIYKAIEKGHIAKENNIDLFIDDKVEMCDKVALEGIDVIHIKGKEKTNYMEFDNWLDILEYIKSK